MKNLLPLLMLTGLLSVSCSSSTDRIAEPEMLCNDNQPDRPYDCSGIDLMARVDLGELDADRLNDIWGWTDPQTGREYALVGLSDGVSFVDITVPTEPAVVGKLPEPEGMPSNRREPGFHVLHDELDGAKSTWRDLKVYDGHLYVVSDQQPHGLQVFSLDRLREVTDPPATFSADHHFTGFTYAHNLAINEATGTAYIVGSNRHGGGLLILDLSDPLQPAEAGFHTDPEVGLNGGGYVHDTQCVIYDGPDTRYEGQELCFNSAETALAIVDVTDREQPVTLSRSGYEGQRYVHQGWLTEDHSYFLVDDELDELNGESSLTRTYIFDVRDLENPELIGTHEGATGSIDHNQYVRGNLLYQANYTSGLRILSLDEVSEGRLSEVAWFDTYPVHDQPEFLGAWSNYPYFGSGIVVVSDISRGLYILRPHH